MYRGSLFQAQTQLNVVSAKMLLLLVALLFLTSSVWSETLDCTGHYVYSARGTAYYPSDDPMEGGFYDMHGNRLHTLQVKP